MDKNWLLKEIDELPNECQREIVDFVGYLRNRYGSVGPKTARRGKLRGEPFIGIWKARKDMKDSTGWTRDLRGSEWEG